MGEEKAFSYAQFVAANVGRNTSGFNYLHLVYKSEELDSDFILWFAKLFWPEFKNVDGLIFISELFDSERYRSLLSSGYTSEKAQFWINLLEITGLFDELSSEKAYVIAEMLANSWNAKLKNEPVKIINTAKAIWDQETQEVFVTITGNA